MARAQQRPDASELGPQRAGSSRTAIADPTLPASDLAGAIVNVWSGIDPWTHVTGFVTSASGGTITFAPEGDGCPYFCSMPGGFYYVTGARALLRAQNEWWYDPRAHTLYLWAPKGVDPATLDVEAKQRGIEIDLRGRSGVIVSNVTVAGGGIATDGRSHGNVLDGITARYLVRDALAEQPVLQLLQLPIRERHRARGHAQHHTKQHDRIQCDERRALEGTGNTITNSLIHDVDWLGDYGAGVVPETAGNTISHNIYNVGRSAIDFGPIAGLEHRVQ